MFNTLASSTGSDCDFQPHPGMGQSTVIGDMMATLKRLRGASVYSSLSLLLDAVASMVDSGSA